MTRWLWVLIGAGLMGSIAIGTVLTVLNTDILIRITDPEMRFWVFEIATGIGYFFGGVVVAVLSPGRTIREPMIAAILAFAGQTLFLLLHQVEGVRLEISLRGFVQMGAIAGGLAWIGAWLGERMSRTKGVPKEVRWFWVLVAAVIMGGIAVGGLLTVQHTDLLYAIEQPIMRFWVYQLGTGVGFFAGGLVVALLSPGRTLREPMIGAVLAFVGQSVFMLQTPVRGVQREVVLWGFLQLAVIDGALAYGGAWLGEYLSRDEDEAAETSEKEDNAGDEAEDPAGS